MLVQSILFDDQQYGGTGWIRRPLDNIAEVILAWNSDGGPGQRGAFALRFMSQHSICFVSNMASSGILSRTENTSYVLLSIPAPS